MDTTVYATALPEILQSTPRHTVFIPLESLTHTSSNLSLVGLQQACTSLILRILDATPAANAKISLAIFAGEYPGSVKADCKLPHLAGLVRAPRTNLGIWKDRWSVIRGLAA